MHVLWYMFDITEVLFNEYETYSDLKRDRTRRVLGDWLVKQCLMPYRQYFSHLKKKNQNKSIKIYMVLSLSARWSFVINQFFFTFSLENRNILSRKGGGGQPLSDSPSKISHTVANYMYVPSKNHDSFWSRIYKTKLCLTKKKYQKLVLKKTKTFLFAFINQDYILKWIK